MKSYTLPKTTLNAFHCLAIVGIALATSCTASVANSPNASTTTTPPEPIPDRLASDAEPLDITDTVLTSTESSCADHVGTYISKPNETQTRPVEGKLTVSVKDEICLFESNQIPNHEPGSALGADESVEPRPLQLEIPARPMIAESFTRIGLGTNAVLLNGVPWEALFDACFDAGDEPVGTETAFCGEDPQNPWRYNTGSELSDFGFDDWNAHLQTDGHYHYHSQPAALFDPDCADTGPSPTIGFALDGFPVFGPCYEDPNGDIKKALSSYQVKDGKREDIDGYTTPRQVGNVAGDNYDGQFNGDYEYVEGSGDLDECNGMQVGDVYGYYLTDDYPHVLACYSGTPLP